MKISRFTGKSLRVVLSLSFGVAMASPLLADEGAKKTKWKLAWSDEFAKPELDLTKWTRVKKGKADWNNMMSPRKDLLEIQDGILRLRGIVNKDEKTKKAQPFLTAGLTSAGKYDFTYGKVEIRARFQSAKGAWPALWMLRSNVRYGTPKTGEIDIMEHLNFDDAVYQTVHSYYTLKVNKKDNLKKHAKSRIVRDKWNTYGIIWDANKITFTVNGKSTFSYPRVPAKGAVQYPFNAPFYFILSMQVEGNWVGKPDPKDYPAFMEIDYVRVYQKEQAKP